MFHNISTDRVIAWDLANTDLMRLSPHSQLHSLICHKNETQDAKLFINVIKMMEFTVLTEIYISFEKKATHPLISHCGVNRGSQSVSV